MALKIADRGSRIVDWTRLVASFLILLTWSTRAPAQALSNAAEIRNPKSEIRKPLFWADGITRTDQLNAYARLGLNTVVVRLYWQAAPGGQIVASDLEPQRQFALSAASLGLQIIYALPPFPIGDENQLEMAGDSKPYRALWAAWTQRAMQELGDTPNLRGWMLPDDPRGLPFTGNAGFARWIVGNYGSIAVLNKQWKTGFKSFDEITLASARRIVAGWRGNGPLMGERSRTDISQYFQTAQKRSPNQNFAFHPIELALANYQWDAYRLLLDFWAQTIRSFDARAVILSGRLPDYAQLLSLPPSVNVSVPFLAPGWAENDVATHNPQAVAVARRGGRFAAIPVLSTSLPNAPDGLVARLLPSWCDAALAQGAKGLAFDSWLDIVENPDLNGAVESTLRRLKTPAFAALWSQEPQASSAIVLTPLADGFTWHPPRNAENEAAAPRGMFGFGEDMITGEPSDLVYALRWGTIFGAVDFLSPDELGNSYSASRGGVLKPYGTVLLPSALSVSPATAQELATYASGGGVVIADIGLGARENGGQVVGLPDTLEAMFGVSPVIMQTVSFNLKAITPHPLLPTWSAFTATNQITTGGDGPKGTAFAGPTLLTELAPGTVPLALGFQIPVPLAPDPNTPNTPPRTRMLRSWLTLRPFGNGAAIFAPFRLWNFWHPGYPGFDALHGDLLSRGAMLSQLGATALVPAPPGAPEGAALFPVAVNFQNAIALMNCNAAGTAPYPAYNLPRRIETPPDAASTPFPKATPIPEENPMSGAITPARDELLNTRKYSGARVQWIADTKRPKNPDATFHRIPTPDADAPTATPTPTPKPNIRPRTAPNSRPSTSVAPAPEFHLSNPTRVPPLPSLAPPLVPALGSDGNAGNTARGIVPSTPPMPAVVQTTGVDQFLWSDAICVFPVGAAPPSTPGRRPPIDYNTGGSAGDAHFIVPAATHPVILHAFIPAQEMRVLRLLPIRALNTGGGPLTARVRIYAPQKIELRAWPNAQAASPGPNEWRVISGAEGLVRFSIFDREQVGDYRTAPGSKHVVAITEISSDGKNQVAATRNYVLAADAQGMLSFELKGIALAISITPFTEASTPAEDGAIAEGGAPEVLAITPDPNEIIPRDNTLPAGTPVPKPSPPAPRTAPTPRPTPKPKPKADVRLPRPGSTPLPKEEPDEPPPALGDDGSPIFHKRYGR